MEPRQNAIVATLDELEIPLNVRTIESRKLLQKAAYLAQESGIPLGYDYGWHQMGPYSPELAEDYQEAAFALNSFSKEDLRPLRSAYRASAQNLKPFLQPPPELSLSKPEWVELLASTHFLRKYVGQSNRQAHSTLYRQRRPLSKHLESALEALTRARLL